MALTSISRISLFLCIASSMQSGLVAENQTEKIEEWWNQFSTSYPKYETTTQILHEMQIAFPDLVKVYSIGWSVESREMWVINLRVNVTQERKLMQPQMKIVANIHGDETVGRALILMLAVDLVREYVKNNTRAVNLLEATDIHLLPSINPDGFEALPEEWNCSPSLNVTGRLNAKLVDLNTDFPDRFNRQSSKTPQLETKNVIRWIKNRNFILSVSLFSGNLMVSFPFNSVAPNILGLDTYQGTGVYALTEENDVFEHLARIYARSHRTMTSFSSSCDVDGKERDAIINGAYWRNQNGTMQDYNYDTMKCFEISVYLSCCKYPDASTLLIEWENNKEALYRLIEATHMGFKGMVKDVNIYAKDLSITVEKIENDFHSSVVNKATRISNRGEYWRLALPGTYNVSLGGLTSDFLKPELSVTVGNASIIRPTVLDIKPPVNEYKVMETRILRILGIILIVAALSGVGFIFFDGCRYLFLTDCCTFSEPEEECF